jgi:hypothetical protein
LRKRNKFVPKFVPGKIFFTMPKVKEVEINYQQICELVKQLEFKEKVGLLREVTKETSYRENFYNYTEGLAKQYNIPAMTEEELDEFLHKEVQKRLNLCKKKS